MIFVTLGSQKFQFNRLIKKIDELVADGVITDEVFAQIGYSDYKPQNYKYKDFLDREEFSAWVDKADLVITHGGTGAIIGAVKKGKKVIAVPRLSCYGEHVDDHQLQIIDEFDQMELIVACRNLDSLDSMLLCSESASSGNYHSGISNIIEDINSFIQERFYGIK